MVAIVAGQSFGLGQTSARSLGVGGVLGTPAASYLGSSFFVNATSGNVVIQNQDEILTGVGQDLVLSRMLNELRVAFTIGFVILLPFLLIDLVVSAILLSLGMLMVPPATISLPLKILMFVLIDGWALILEGLVGSFH